jgi:hypothetical protein
MVKANLEDIEGSREATSSQWYPRRRANQNQTDVFLGGGNALDGGL